MDASLNGHISGMQRVVGAVWYNGTDAIKQGEAVCYDIANGTATAVSGRRHNQVVRPTAATANAFAGVSERSYPAQANGQFIEINMPGSKGVMVALGADTVINTGILTFQAGGGTGAGRFVKAGYVGRGSIIPRQTVTAVLEASMTGAWSLATDGKTLTVVATAGLAAGDTVVLLGGEIEDGGASVVPGKYTISSVTNGTVMVLTASAISGTALLAVLCTGYAYTGNPVCQADLLDGEESGGVEFISPPNAGLVGLSYMTSGISYVCGGLTLAADVDVTFAQGTVFGQRKGFLALGTMTTNDVTVDLVTNGFTMTGGALAEINAIDAALDGAHLVFNGVWRCVNLAGAAAEA